MFSEIEKTVTKVLVDTSDPETIVKFYDSWSEKYAEDLILIGNYTGFFFYPYSSWLSFFSSLLLHPRACYIVLRLVLFKRLFNCHLEFCCYFHCTLFLILGHIKCVEAFLRLNLDHSVQVKGVPRNDTIPDFDRLAAYKVWKTIPR